jgi:hypothetical protein
LDGVASSGELHALQLAPDLYPVSAQTAAAYEFSPLCRADVTPCPDSYLLSLTVHDEHRPEAGRIVGEFLNYVLALSVRDRLWPDR